MTEREICEKVGVVIDVHVLRLMDGSFTRDNH